MASTGTTTMAIARAVIMAMAVAPARSMVIKMKVMAMNAEAMAVMRAATTGAVKTMMAKVATERVVMPRVEEAEVVQERATGMASEVEAMAARVVAGRGMYWAEGGQGGDEDDGESASGSNKMAKVQMLCT